MSEPVSPSPQTPAPSGCGRVILWIVAGLAFVGAVGGYFYWQHEQQVARDIARYEELRQKVHYEAELFPAKVTFQRGATRRDDYKDGTPSFVEKREFGTSDDDSEGKELAEFYLLKKDVAAPALPEGWLADGSHPAIRSRLQALFEVAEPQSLFGAAIAMQSEEFDGWTLRARLIPSPHGGLKVPNGLPQAELAKLNEKSPGNAPVKGEVDARLSTGSPTGVASSRVDQRAIAQRKLDERHNADLRTYDDRHHHYYLVEAVRDFGDGKVIVLRRYGQVYGDGTVERAVETIRKMAGSVVIGKN